VAFEPKRPGRNDRVNTGIAPPRGFIATPVHLAMVPAAERNRELVADLATECSALNKPEMMGVRRLSTANQARVLSDRSDVITVTHAAGFGPCQHALIDRSGASSAPRF